jgi:hypothetical protein
VQGSLSDYDIGPLIREMVGRQKIVAFEEREE